MEITGGSLVIIELKERRFLFALIHDKWAAGGKTTANTLVAQFHFFCLYHCLQDILLIASQAVAAQLPFFCLYLRLPPSSIDIRPGDGFDQQTGVGMLRGFDNSIYIPCLHH